MSEEEFVARLLEDQPFVPQYFPFDVELNRTGAVPLAESLSRIGIRETAEGEKLDEAVWVVDTRPEDDFKKGHLPHALNLMEDGKFETWLGSIIAPGEKFYLAGENREQVQRMMRRAAAIGYETGIEEALVVKGGDVKEAKLDMEQFKKNPEGYTTVDVRSETGVEAGKPFAHSHSIPLAEVRERVAEIPTGKPIVVHCAGGYRSAAASSLIHATLNGQVPVLDLGEDIKQFLK